MLVIRIVLIAFFAVACLGIEKCDLSLLPPVEVQEAPVYVPLAEEQLLTVEELRDWVLFAALTDSDGLPPFLHDRGFRIGYGPTVPDYEGSGVTLHSFYVEPSEGRVMDYWLCHRAVESPVTRVELRANLMRVILLTPPAVQSDVEGFEDRVVATYELVEGDFTMFALERVDVIAPLELSDPEVDGNVLYFEVE